MDACLHMKAASRFHTACIMLELSMLEKSHVLCLCPRYCCGMVCLFPLGTSPRKHHHLLAMHDAHGVAGQFRCDIAAAVDALAVVGMITLPQ